MFITVKSVGPIEIKQGPKAQYQVFALTYEKNGELSTRHIMEFAKDVFGKFKDAAIGSTWEVDVKKNGKYWDWVAASPTTVGAAPAATGSGGSGGRWNGETAEERALRQLLIVRQSSIANALTYSGNQKTALPLAEVLLIAKKFEDFVYGKNAPDLNEGEIQ